MPPNATATAERPSRTVNAPDKDPQPTTALATVVDAEVVAAVQALASNGRPAAQQRLPGLAAALALAQQKCKGAEKDRKNKFHNYRYASAESIIATAKEALADTGLSLLPVSRQLNGHEKTGENRYEWDARFLLLHESGESAPISTIWPVCEEKGRPLDKAVAIADTLSLEYLLRDLLLMPRVDETDEPDAREDPVTEEQPEPVAPRERQPETARRPAPVPAPSTAPPSPPASTHQVARIRELIQQTGRTPVQMDVTWRHFDVSGPELLTADQASALIRRMDAELKQPAATG